ncbi:HTH domain-containing protein [Nocardioides sp. GY 10113]|uniref:helix-turn-helix domain-containing protein n=1 Tax=Nocardioides sp. GY 10113 TaxID=2569761 RepID=UPI0010A93323|nr:LuxR C-terminal-related transcriptional regulator [Nocardioides sp. GY 10113]TIC85023.1 HTH domain-containing protein [Nocardioides sp. GY 10113]
MTGRTSVDPAAAFRWEPGSQDVTVLGLVAAGHTTEAIARRLEVSDRTVRRRLRAAADDLGVGTTIEVVVHAVRTGLI